ncbi:MAG: hypothetical protein IJ360_03145 [Clostridia bacterium]|nr:hypothetical protein [Clostridia bacterium]
MKKIIKTLLVVMVLAVVLTAFTGCDAVETLKGIIPSELAAMIPPQLTCSVLGHKGAEHTPCERCGEVWMESNVSLECVLNGHKMVSVTQILPTCTEDGMTSGLVCSVCGHEDAPRKVLPATGHKMIPATCEVAEYCIYCRITGAEALGHTPVDVPAVAPTCSSVGYTAGQVCGVCDKVLNGFEEIAKDPEAHGAAVEIPALAPTCSTPGHTAGTGCEYCGTAFTGCEEIAIDPDAHYFVSGLCAICQKVFEYGVGDNTRVALDTLGVAQDGSLFEFVYFAVTEAGHYKISGQNIITSIFTLDASGNTVFVNPLVDLNNPLTWGEAYLEPGYYVLGLNYYAGAGEYTFNIAKIDCTNTEEVTKAPTCTETGLKTTTCTVCGHVVEGVEVPATGHTNGTPVEENRVEATCSANGSYDSVVYCTVCETEVSREANVIPAVAHSFVEGICSKCGATDPKHYFVVTIPEALKKADGSKVQVSGTVVGIYQAYDSYYKNTSVYVADEAGNQILLFRLPGEWGLGDKVTVKGEIDIYNQKAQIAQGATVVSSEKHVCSDFTPATCTEAAQCKVCFKSSGEPLGHTTESGECARCGQTIGGSAPVVSTLAEFTFGANGSATHTDPNSKFSNGKSYTVNGYTLKFTSATNCYDGGRDAKGNSCMKMGTSSKTGSFTVTVPENVTEVVIYVAQYKANATKISVNGGAAKTITTASNNGEYTAIVIDTSVNKTLTFATVSGGVRCMINTIVFNGTAK